MSESDRLSSSDSDPDSPVDRDPHDTPHHSSSSSSAHSTLATAAWGSTAWSTATSHPPLRFYRTAELNENPLRNPDVPWDPLEARRREALEQCRSIALQTIDECQQVVTTLELSRMTASRAGTRIWIAFWERLYTRDMIRKISDLVSQAQRRINTLFHNTAGRLHTALAQIRNNIRVAAMEGQIIWELEIVQEHAYWERERRRRKAGRIMDKFGEYLSRAVPLRVTPEKMIDIKRGMFSLDSVCDYYPHSLSDGHTAVALRSPSADPRPFLQYDPTLDPRQHTVFQHDGAFYNIPPGYRPVGNYYLDPNRLV